jgi:hypothetical protein
MHLGLLQQPPAQLSRKTAALIKKPHFSTASTRSRHSGCATQLPERVVESGHSYRSDLDIFMVEDAVDFVWEDAANTNPKAPQ